MERTINYRLYCWFSETTDEDIQVLAMDPDDMGLILEVEPGYALRVN